MFSWVSTISKRDSQPVSLRRAHLPFGPLPVRQVDGFPPAKCSRGQCALHPERWGHLVLRALLRAAELAPLQRAAGPRTMMRPCSGSAHGTSLGLRAREGSGCCEEDAIACSSTANGASSLARIGREGRQTMKRRIPLDQQHLRLQLEPRWPGGLASRWHPIHWQAEPQTRERESGAERP